MNKTKNFGFNLPSNTDPNEIADIGYLNENFVKADEVLKEIKDQQDEGGETPKIEVDSSFSATSKNPVENRVISNGVANAIKIKEEGNQVRLDGISPLQHEIQVNVSVEQMLAIAEEGNIIDYSLDASDEQYETGYIYTVSSVEENGEAVTLHLEGGCYISYTTDWPYVDPTRPEAGDRIYVEFPNPVLMEIVVYVYLFKNVPEKGAIIKRCGKNFLDISKLVVTPDANIRIAEVNVEENYVLIRTKEAYTYNGSLSSRFTLKELCPDIKIGETYTLNGETDSESQKNIYLYGSQPLWRFGSSREISEKDYNSLVYFYGLNVTKEEGTGDCYIRNLQIEPGTVPTAYEKYQEPEILTANEEGKVEGIIGEGQENIILVGNVDSTIKAEYNADTKKYIDKKIAQTLAVALEV